MKSASILLVICFEICFVQPSFAQTHLTVQNPFAVPTLTGSCYYFIRTLSNPPLFAGNIGKLRYLITLSNTAVASATLNNDSLIIMGKASGSTTVTVLATDSFDSSSISYSSNVVCLDLCCGFGCPTSSECTPLNIHTSTRNISFGTVGLSDSKRVSISLIPNDHRISVSRIVLTDSSFSADWSGGFVYPCYGRTFSIDFRPKRLGTISGQLIVQSNAVSASDTVQLSGVGDLMTDVVREEKLHEEFSLGHNFPNPFNPTTSFEFQVPSSEFVTLSVYDVLGRDVATLLAQTMQPGTYKIDWNGSQFPSGLYLCRMQAGNFIATRKLLLQK